MISWEIHLFQITKWITENYTFSGPLTVFVSYQVLKIILPKSQEELEAVLLFISGLGAEIHIICIPILLNTWKNPNALLCKTYGSDPNFLANTLFLLTIFSVLSLWAARKFNTKPRPKLQVVTNFLCSYTKTERSKKRAEGLLNIIRRFIYFSIPFGFGLRWLYELYINQ